MTRISSKFITVNGQRVGVTYSVGPWVAGVPEGLIKIRPRNGQTFPAAIRETFAITNLSDAREDYFVKDEIRMLPSHPLYEAVRNAAA